MKNKNISKLLSLVLRHNPDKIGIKLDNNGYTDVKILIDTINRNIDKNFNLEALKYIVKFNDKKRFAFSDDFTKIRASQGHSLNVDLNIEEVKPLDVLYHGTSLNYIKSIYEIGFILKMKRDHVHLSSDIDTALNVAKRHGIPKILMIDCKSMFLDGYKFYLSENNVYLTDNVPIKYIL